MQIVGKRSASQLTSVRFAKTDPARFVYQPHPLPA